MNGSLNRGFNRRDFLTGTSMMGAAALLGYDLRPAAAEPPLETTRLRLVHLPTVRPTWPSCSSCGR